MVVQNMEFLRQASQQLTGENVSLDPIVQLKEKELELKAQDIKEKHKKVLKK